MFEQLIDFALSLVDKLGYLGIFFGMTLESTIFPLPSEAILIPAGALVAQSKMMLLPIILASVAGSIFGAAINYFLALYLGRPVVNFLVSKYGKFFLISSSAMEKSEVFFRRHGEIATFIGRLIIGVRHLISIPAGFSRMNFFRFVLFTLLGSLVWSIILTYTGFFFGANLDWIKENQKYLLMIFLAISGITLMLYLIFKRKKN